MFVMKNFIRVNFIVSLSCLLCDFSCLQLEACQLRFDFVKMNYVNPNRMKLHEFEAVRSKNSRRISAFNASATTFFDIKLGEMFVQFEVFKFQSNLFRKFPFHLKVDPCWAFNANYIGIKNMLNTTNLTKGCPLVKGYYYGYNLQVMPQYMPSCPPDGQYMVHQVLLKGDELVINGTGVVTVFH